MPLFWVYGCSNDGSAAASCPKAPSWGEPDLLPMCFLQDVFVDASMTFSVALCKLFCKKSDTRLARETKQEEALTRALL